MQDLPTRPRRPIAIQPKTLRRLAGKPLAKIVSPRMLEQRRLDPDRVERLHQRLQQGEELSESEQMILFSIFMQPAAPVLNDLPEHIEGPLWTDLNEPAAHARLEPICRATARVEYSSGAEFQKYGSCFLVADDLVMTNNHVASVFSGNHEVFGPYIRPGYSVRVNFCRERDRWDTDPTASRAVTRIVMRHPWFDLALLRIEGKPDGAEPLALSVADAAGADDARVVVVGYPSKNSEEDVALQNATISEFDTKHLSPGIVGSVETRNINGRTGRLLGHDCSTLTGNSGSAVVDIDSGSVVGLHFRGNLDGSNWAVPASDIASDVRIVDAGVTFDAIPTPGPGPWEDAWNGT